MSNSSLISHIKNEAKKIKKANPGMVHARALDQAAQNAGFNNWMDVHFKLKA